MKAKQKVSTLKLKRLSKLTTVTPAASTTLFGTTTLNLNDFPNWSSTIANWEKVRCKGLKATFTPTRLGDGTISSSPGVYSACLQDTGEGTPAALSDCAVKDGGFIAPISQARSLQRRYRPSEDAIAVWQDTAASIPLEEEIAYALEQMQTTSKTQFIIAIELDLEFKGFKIDL
jgi:hypothetical protein